MFLRGTGGGDLCRQHSCRCGRERLSETDGRIFAVAAQCAGTRCHRQGVSHRLQESRKTLNRTTGHCHRQGMDFGLNMIYSLISATTPRLSGSVDHCICHMVPNFLSINKKVYIFCVGYSSNRPMFDNAPQSSSHDNRTETN